MTKSIATASINRETAVALIDAAIAAAASDVYKRQIRACAPG